MLALGGLFIFLHAGRWCGFRPLRQQFCERFVAPFSKYRLDEIQICSPTKYGSWFSCFCRFSFGSLFVVPSFLRNIFTLLAWLLFPRVFLFFSFSFPCFVFLVFVLISLPLPFFLLFLHPLSSISSCYSPLSPFWLDRYLFFSDCIFVSPFPFFAENVKSCTIFLFFLISIFCFFQPCLFAENVKSDPAVHREFFLNIAKDLKIDPLLARNWYSVVKNVGFYKVRNFLPSSVLRKCFTKFASITNNWTNIIIQKYTAGKKKKDFERGQRAQKEFSRWGQVIRSRAQRVRNHCPNWENYAPVITKPCFLCLGRQTERKNYLKCGEECGLL